MSALQPPRINTEDTGAHELSASEDDDHFSSASEGQPNPKRLSAPRSPIPSTRVERVDDKPAHGEVPGTPAYDKRAQDAVPDEIEIVPEGRRSRAASTLSTLSRPGTPGGSPIPKTVVERVDNKPAYGEVDGTLAKEMRMADAAPDEVRQAPPEAKDGTLHGSDLMSKNPEDQQSWFRGMWEGARPSSPSNDGKETAERSNDDHDNADGEMDDDFDDFAEGNADDDFGDFDEADETEEPIAEPSLSSSLPLMSASSPSLPVLNLAGMSPMAVQEAFEPYFDAMFPQPELESTPEHFDAVSGTSAFVSDRSLSLWQQLVSPPPMQPPNWTRSRIRRLFLVSLGVPVDLDEILPPSKQKRLVLPNIELGNHSSHPGSTLERLKEDAEHNSSRTSLDSKGVPKKSKGTRTLNRGPPPPPEFDANAATILCSTTTEAMSVYTDDELHRHLITLKDLNEKASLVLEYWLQRKDEGLKEKEALEGVIENLVGFVKGRRGR